jgi:hypothetical protein
MITQIMPNLLAIENGKVEKQLRGSWGYPRILLFNRLPKAAGTNLNSKSNHKLGVNYLSSKAHITTCFNALKNIMIKELGF